MSASLTPSIQELELAFAFLEAEGFHQTARLPLVAARSWSWSRELQAFQAFLRKEANTREVGFPRVYWSAEASKLRSLFCALTLGKANPSLAEFPELSTLYAGGGPNCTWSVVSRFERFILRSHPDDSGHDFVYFGDDTLFLMRRSRELMTLLSDRDSSLRILDLCCGSGGVGLAIPDFEGELIGVDLNPVAIQLAQATSAAQGLENYQYLCAEAESALTGEFDLIFGNPPTLDPSLAGRDVFFATGTLDSFLPLLERVFGVLKPKGFAVLTLFSLWDEGEDKTHSAVSDLLRGKRGFRFRVRREFPMGDGKKLRHNVLEIGPEGHWKEEFVPARRSLSLPGLSWRRG